MVFGFAALPEGCKVVPNDDVFNVLSDVMTGKMSAEEWAQKVENSFKVCRLMRRHAALCGMALFFFERGN